MNILINWLGTLFGQKREKMIENYHDTNEYPHVLCQNFVKQLAFNRVIINALAVQKNPKAGKKGGDGDNSHPEQLLENLSFVSTPCRCVCVFGEGGK